MKAEEVMMRKIGNICKVFSLCLLLSHNLGFGQSVKVSDINQKATDEKQKDAKKEAPDKKSPAKPSDQKEDKEGEKTKDASEKEVKKKATDSEKKDAQKPPVKKESPEDKEYANLPFRIEIGTGSGIPQREVVLALGAVTVIHCPEPPLQIIVGEKSGISMAETTESQKTFSAIYLRPTRPGVRTNLWVEMPSAVVPIQLRTVTIKAGVPLNGRYNGEVYVRLPKFQDRLDELSEKVASYESELKVCTQEREQILQNRDEVMAKGTKLAEEQAMEDALAVIESAASSKSFSQFKSGNISVRQLGGARRTASGKWLILLEVENRSGVLIQIEQVEALTYKAKFVARPIAGKARGRAVVIIEGAQSLAPPQLNIQVGGQVIPVVLQP